MEQYIDKSALVEIIKKRYEYWREKEFNSHSLESEIRMSECQHLMLLFNALEVKEADLEKECAKYFEENDLCVHDDYIKFARHFFELGLKAQKGK